MIELYHFNVILGHEYFYENQLILSSCEEIDHYEKFRLSVVKNSLSDETLLSLLEQRELLRFSEIGKRVHVFVVKNLTHIF